MTMTISDHSNSHIRMLALTLETRHVDIMCLCCNDIDDNVLPTCSTCTKNSHSAIFNHLYLGRSEVRQAE